ncbi:prepilin peptidase [Pokkaliibacter sp. CJK22405]|uniref:prepilin peptidase n=1 Tax=Pokkaliibacter sp. CJK22405 TaxID=3384615 RepID=UPI00398483C9
MQAFSALPFATQLCLVIVFGLLVGSFLNVVIHRLPLMLQKDWRKQSLEFLGQSPEDEENQTFNLAVPRSRCPNCKAEVTWWQNLPIISYVLLKGRCHNCRVSISLRYPTVELLNAACWAGLLIAYGPTWTFAALSLMVSALLALIFIDADHQLLPDDITLPLLWAGILFNLLTEHITISSSLWGAMAGYLVLWVLFWLFKIVTGKEGFGYGDFKLLAALGAWGGVFILPWVLLLSAILGIVFALTLRVTGKLAAGEAFPFGPSLATAGGILITCAPFFPQLQLF